MSDLKDRLHRLQQFQATDPGNSQLLADIGQLHLQLKQFNEALSAFTSAYVLKPDAAYAFQQATAYLALEQYQHAIHLLENLLAQGIDNVGIHFNLAYSYLYLSQPEKARQHLQQLSNDDINSIPNARIILGRTQHFMGDLDNAAATLQAHIQQQPDDAFAQGMLALLEADRENNAEATRLAQQALQHQPGLTDALLAVGQVNLFDYQLDQASEYFEQVLVNSPQSGRAWLGKGLAAMSNLDLANAEAHLQQAVKYWPDHLGCRNTLAWAQLSQNKLADAETTMRSALVKDRNFGDSYGTLAAILWLQGRKDEALHNLKLGKKLDPDSFSCRYVEFLQLNDSGEILEARALMRDTFNRPMQADTPNSLTLQQGIQRLLKNKRQPIITSSTGKESR